MKLYRYLFIITFMVVVTLGCDNTRPPEVVGIVKLGDLDIRVIEPGGGTVAPGYEASMATGSHEITMGDVEIVVNNLKLSINGRNYGDVRDGDSVIIDELRKVTINGVPRESIQN